jgi:hypothetical protein
MKKISNAEELKQAIGELETKKTLDEAALKYEFSQVRETYKPSNLIKNTVSEVAASPKFRYNALNIVLGLGAGYLSRKLLVGGRSAGLLKRTLGTALQYGVSSLISKSADESLGAPPKKGNLLKRIFSR